MGNKYIPTHENVEARSPKMFLAHILREVMLIILMIKFTHQNFKRPYPKNYKTYLHKIKRKRKLKNTGCC